MISIAIRNDIFQDKLLQQQFNDNGYVVVPFINESAVERLLTTYKQFYPDGVKGFFSTTFANNKEHRAGVNEAIKKNCLDKIDIIFQDYKIMFSSFIVKAPDQSSELIMHQDMTLVDENKYSGVNIWCPLIDLNSTNGAIQLIPKSHRFYKTYRGSTLPDIYDNVKTEIKSLMQPLYLKKGEAVIFDQSIIHYSPANLSNEERPVINTFITSKEARIQICYWDKNTYGNNVEIFEQEDDFLENFENFGHNIFSKPSIGKSLGLFAFDFPKLTVQTIEDSLNVTLDKPSVVKKIRFWHKLFS
jgi:ectoine hydroxylase-related dioxygenase (phytanoyl-CoA dioxygenase family)